MPTVDNRKGKGEFADLSSIARAYAGNLKTVDEIASRTGINRMTVNRILNGHGVNQAFLFQYAIAFQKPVNPLLKAIGEPERHPDPCSPLGDLAPEEARLRELLPAADLVKTSPEALATALQNPDVAATVKFVVEEQLPIKDFAKQRKYAEFYLSFLEGMKKSRAVKKRRAIKTDKTEEPKPEEI